uniref:Uncharacterized protein n=1 Tax=Alexandrium catenella TaxID=2925 RepID=A0A7S1WUN5_ALECA|mmetsp:Transcript_91249/g.242371  ORF Transcript_91249/g.242371 Transcript_91249/m.242371 type:complete len:302 (+) Transcript_91249:29-934(+)
MAGRRARWKGLRPLIACSSFAVALGACGREQSGACSGDDAGDESSLLVKPARRSANATARLAADAAASLFCWSLARPRGDERDLLELQYREGASIFACDEFAFYSSSETNITGQGGSIVQAVVVPHNMSCKLGNFQAANNTRIFLKVWKKLIDDGRYRFHAWTVKSDPDAVFFPARLRMIVSKTEDPQAGNGVFLNNCYHGLHGPLEVLSRRSMELYAVRGMETCPFEQVEDFYLYRCLLKLGAKQVDAFDILSERNCETEGWELCGDHHAAFHPFKKEEPWAQCLQRAREFDGNRALRHG